MPSRVPLQSLAAAALLASAHAVAAPKLPPEADQALTKAEKILGKTQGDDRVVACIDAIAPLEVVVKAAPEYAYPAGLLADCYFLNDKWDGAIEQTEHWLTLVPPEARVGPVLEKVQKAIQRLRIAYMKTGRALSGLPTPKPKDAPLTPPTPETTAAASAEARNTLEPQPGRADVTNEKPPTPVVPAPVEPLPPPPPDEPDVPAENQIALRAGYSPLTGGIGAGLEARLGMFHLAIGSGAYPFTAGAGASLPLGPGRAYAELHFIRIGSSLLVDRVTGRNAFGATIGYDLRPLRFLSVKVGVGAGYEQLLGQPMRLVFDAAVGPVFAF